MAQDMSSVSRTVLFSVSIVAVTALCLGYDAGVMSGAIAPIRKRFELRPWEEGIVMGCLNVVAAFSAPLGSWAADRFGRVPGIALTAVFLVGGPIVVALSWNFHTLVLGRVVTGIGVGLAFVIAPLYAAELAPPQLRGRLVTIVEVLINLGVLLGYASALLLEPNSGGLGWRFVTGLAAFPAVLVLLIVPWLPESPRWLAANQLWQEAESVLEKVYHTELEVKEGRRELESALKHEMQGSWAEVFCPTPVVRRMLLAGLGCAFFQQASGSEAIVYYSPQLIDAFGVEGAHHQNRATIFVGLAKFGGALLGGPFLDTFGRRPGVIVSSVGMAACLGLLALSLDMSPDYLVGLSLLCLFMIAFELGLAPAAFVLGTESYPMPIRGKALSLGMFTTRFLSGSVAIAFPILMHELSLAMTLWLFCFIGCIGVVWAVACVRETKGLSLEDATKLYEAESSQNYGATQ